MVKIPNCSSESFDEIFKAITNRSYILLHTLTKSFCNYYLLADALEIIKNLNLHNYKALIQIVDFNCF